MEITHGIQFRDLPLELRQQIWTLVLPGPRTIPVNRCLKAPLALHINREARSVALRHYELVCLEYSRTGQPIVCLNGYIDFEVDIIHLFGLRSSEELDKKICHLQYNTWLLGNMSQARLFIMTDHALSKFPRLRSYKSVVHYNSNLRGVEFDLLLPGEISEERFGQQLDGMVASISRRIEEIKVTKARDGLDWEPPIYHFVRCERNLAGLKCGDQISCDGLLDTMV
jgi:2EXR family